MKYKISTQTEPCCKQKYIFIHHLKKADTNLQFFPISKTSDSNNLYDAYIYKLVGFIPLAWLALHART